MRFQASSTHPVSLLRRLAACAALVLASVTTAGGDILIHSRELRGFRAEVATLMVQGLEGGAFPLALTVFSDRARPVSGEKDRYVVPVVAEIAGAGLMGSAKNGESPVAEKRELELYLYAIDDKGAVVGHAARVLELDLDRIGESLFAEGLRARVDLTLPEGDLSLRALALDATSGHFAGAVASAQVWPGAEEPFLGPPRFHGPCEPWVSAATVGDEKTLAVRPVVAAGTAVNFDVVTRAARLGARDQASTLERLQVVLRSIDGSSGLPEVEVIRLSAEIAAPQATGNVLAARVSIPEDASGVYEMRVEVPAWGARSAGTELWVLTPSEHGALEAEGSSKVSAGRGCGPSWAAVLRRAGSLSGKPSSDRSLEADDGRRKRAAHTRDRYLRTLQGLAHSGDLDSAVTELATLEEAAVSEGLTAFADLRRTELAAARALVEIEAEALLPLMELHARAYHHHFESRHFGLATHSRELVIALGEDWVDADRGEFGPVELVADVMTRLAALAERRGVEVASQRLLERAVELVPEHPQALMLLAMSYERLGRYSLAVDRLEALSRVSSENEEARLRLAINLERLGETARAESELRSLIRESDRGWKAALAHEALARTLFRQERFGEAVIELKKGIEAAPRSQQLRLLLAYALDRLGEFHQASQVLDSLPAGVAGGGSPRYLYTEPQSEALDRLVRSLGENTRVRLPLLARALRGRLSGDKGP